jgi:hypothetical protein
MKARLLAAALTTITALAAGGAAFGGDSEFDRIVKAVESRYGARPLHIPFMGVANFALKVTHPEGATGVKLAVFEGVKDLQSADDRGAWHERDRFMDSLSGPHLCPLVRVHSRRDAEATYIFIDAANKPGKSARVLIATFQPNEAVVVEVKANIDTLLKALEEPERAGRTLGGEK